MYHSSNTPYRSQQTSQTSGILDLFEPTELLRCLETAHDRQTDDDPNFVCLDLAIAIGARCHPDKQRFASCESIHFSRSRAQMGLYLLEDVRLQTVKISLLAAFYMLCASRRNVAYMYLGVAARAAHVMGLHHEESHAQTQDSHRLRLWKSLRVFESMVSSFLGRPSATSQQNGKSLTESGIDVRGQSTSSSAVDATYQLLGTLESIVDDMYRQQITSAASANHLLERLRDWSKNLHPPASQAAMSGSFGNSDRNLVLGRMHVSCSYYFAVILITRPYLMHHLMLELLRHGDARADNFDSPPKSVDGSSGPEIYALAHTCEDAAVLLLNSCYEALQADMLVDNMCLTQ